MRTRSFAMPAALYFARCSRYETPDAKLRRTALDRAFESDRIVTVFGGSGFIGRHVVRALARRGWRVKVAVRRPDLAFHLQTLGVVGQIAAVQANVRYPDSVARALAGASAVVNLVGVLAEGGAQTFEAVQAKGAETVARATAAAGIGRLVQMSAQTGADSDSSYARTKRAGEKAALAAIPSAVIIRPSVAFGPEDTFFNRFAGMARISPVLPLIHGGTRFQPVFAGDVAEAIALGVDGRIEGGRAYELGGPEILTFRQCLELMLEEIGRKRLLLPIPGPIAAIVGGIAQLLPGKLLTADQVRQLAFDTVVSDEAIREGRTLQGMGITPTGAAAILPLYLERYRARGQFDRKSRA
jgi:NADH dehydrogenase